jgi:uncharacterized protein YaaQ
MKLIITIIKDTDDRSVINSLVSENFRVTRMASMGGFLRQGNVTLMIGVDDDRVMQAVDLIKRACKEPEKGQHRATIFVVNAIHFEQT